MDIAIRASESMGGTRQDMRQLQQGGEANRQMHFYRGGRPRYCDPGERVFFLEKGFFHGYAILHGYQWCKAEPGSGRQDGWAIVVRAPYVPIEPPIQAPEGFRRGSYRWRYIDRHPETVQLLRSTGL